MEMWRYQSLGEEFGPVPTDVLENLLRTGTLSPADLVRREGESWRPAGEFPELQAALGSSASPATEDPDLLRLLNQVGGDGRSVSTGGAKARPSSSAQQWYTEILGQELGPLEWDELTAMVGRGELSPTDRVRRGPAGEWQRADEIVGLFPESAASPTPWSRTEGAETAAGEATWFIEEEEGRPRGPYTYPMLRSLAAAGRLGPRDRVREGAAGPWVRAATLPGLFAELTETRSLSGRAERSVPAGDAPTVEVPQTGSLGSTAGEKPAAGTAADSGSSAAESGRDEWSEFFETVEARERRKWRREPAAVPRSPAGSVASPASAVQAKTVPPPSLSPPSAVPPAPATAGTVSPSMPSATPSPVESAPAAPAFVAPPRPKRSLSLPALNLSGLFAQLKGAAGGGLGVKLLLPLAIVLVLGAWQFLPGLLGGTPGREFYEPIEQLWQQIIQLHTRQAPPEEWEALAASSLPLLDEAQQKLAPIVARQGIKAPLAQRLLWMVDKEDGPTRAKGYLRKALDSKGRLEGGDIMTGNALLSEAASYLPR